MRRSLTVILLTSLWVFLSGSVICLADTEWECMFCHQYPGLVMPLGAEDNKIISIDLEKYFSSPHGKAACRACHSRIESVPHTGASEVECTTSCHIEDKDKIEKMDMSSYKVHKDEQRSISSLQDNSSCRVCHQLFPHSRNLKVRAILNMHMGYMLCGMCHLKKEEMGKIAYDWKKPDKATFIGEPYGRYTRIEPGKIDMIREYISGLISRIFGEETTREETAMPEYKISRIAVFSLVRGERILHIDIEDSGKAAAFLSREKGLSAGEKEKEMKYFHRDITEHEFSVACNECHSSKGILDFRQLGYDNNKTRQLKDMDVKRLETEYKIFHFPHMLK